MPFEWEGPAPAETGAGAAKAAGAVSALNSKALDSAKVQTRELLNAAKSGGFRLSPQGVADLRNALAKMQSDVSSIMQGPVYYLAQRPKLGSHDYGHAVAEHDQKSADNQAGSASFVLKQFMQVLTDADQALRIAARNYEEAESNATSNFRSGQV